MPTTDDRGRIFADAAAYADFDGWHATAAELRAEGPLTRVELPRRDPFWVVLGQPEVMEVEKSSDVFTNEPMSTLAPAASVDRRAPTGGDDQHARPDGRRRPQEARALVNDWFKPGQIRKLTERVEEQARRSVDEMQAKGGALRLRRRRGHELPAAGHPRDPRTCPRRTSRACSA